MRLSAFSVNCCHYEWTLSWKTDLFPPISFTKQFDVCSFRELIGSLLSVWGRQRPEQKKIYIFSRSAWPSKSSAVRKCNCFSPYCAKTPMNFSIQILTIYRTNGILLPKLFWPKLLWEKIVLVTEKNFWNSRLKAENLQKFCEL